MRLKCIVLLLAAVTAAAPAAAQAQDSSDVRGGFFEKEKLERGFFNEAPVKSKRTRRAAKALRAGGTADSFAVPLKHALRDSAHDAATAVLPSPSPEPEPKAAPAPAKSAVGSIPPRTDAPAPPAANDARGSEALRRGRPSLAAGALPKMKPSDQLWQRPSRSADVRYAPRSVLSLVVNGADNERALVHLKQLAWLKKHRNVKLGEVLLIGIGELPEAVAAANSVRARRGGNSREAAGKAHSVNPLIHYAEEAGLPHASVQHDESILRRLKVRHSPTWVIRHEGRDYVYEGLQNPLSLFDGSGRFVGSDKGPL